MTPLYTVSGYRGIVGDTMTNETVAGMVAGYADLIRAAGGTRVIVGRDTRPSGYEFARIASETLMAKGISVVDVGIATTPTIFLLVREEQCDGAVIITASHNPAEYNGIKLANKKGFYLDPTERDELNKRRDMTISDAPVSGQYVEMAELADKHIAKILSVIDVAAIRAKNFRVVLDCINGAGAIITPRLLAELGCDTYVINGEPSGVFAHTPEPLPEHLTGLADTVMRREATIGFAQDPDADRLVICDENGVLLSEHHTLTLAVFAALKKHQGPVVVNLATSRMCEDIAERFGVPLFKTKIGEPNVIDGMLAHDAVIGGEGAASGVIYPAINFCRDSLTGIALILELLARENRPLSEIVDSIPKYVSKRGKRTIHGDLAPYYQALTDAFPEGKTTADDGLRFDFADKAWIIIRPSNTEPIVRLNGEARTSERIEAIFAKALAAIDF